MMAEQQLKRAGRKLGLVLPHGLSSALTLAVLELCAARWFFPPLEDRQAVGRWVIGGGCCLWRMQEHCPLILAVRCCLHVILAFRGGGACSVQLCGLISKSDMHCQQLNRKSMRSWDCR